MNETINVAEAYDKGRTVFMGIDLLVGPGALVPRPETELLGASAVDALRQLNVPAPRMIDMCCGAGNLACAVSLKVPGVRAWASDLTDGCVDVARRNVAHHGLSDRVSVLQGDLFDAFSGLRLEGTIDLIVCNPPYISEARLKGDRAVLLELEPREAFAAGPYGLSIHMRVTKDALPISAAVAASCCSRSVSARSGRLRHCLSAARPTRTSGWSPTKQVKAAWSWDTQRDKTGRYAQQRHTSASI